MPLIKTVLSSELSKLLDGSNANFTGFPADIVGVAVNWSEAINVYASAIIPISTTSELAKVAFNLAMMQMSSILGNGLIVLSTAFSAYAGILATGMVGAGFTGTPPPIPINFAPVIPLGLSGIPVSTIVSLMSDIIDVWFRTGIAVNIATAIPTIWA